VKVRVTRNHVHQICCLRILILLSDLDPRSVLLKIDGVSYKFKKGTTHSTNKRFVGYIAQQIESVVPEAVQLIDGILHVDYESLIPYLSESIKQNLIDTNNINSKQNHINNIVDMLYEDFVKREKASRSNGNKSKQSKPTSSTNNIQRRCSKFGWHHIIMMVLGIATIIFVVIIGTYLIINRKTPVHNTPSPTPSPPQTPTNPSFVPMTIGTPQTATPLPVFVPVPIVPPYKDPDRVALWDLCTATNGQDWRMPSGPEDRWSLDKPMCSWKGVECFRARVTQLWLSYSALNGTLPNTIGNLSEAYALHLDFNYLRGTIPATLRQVVGLNTLVLSNNPQLSGSIPELPTTLAYLELAKCNITGTIPDSVTKMKLETLILSNNQLSGTLPRLYFPQSKLDLANNRLEGTIPPFKGSVWLWSYDSLKLANNSLSGTLQSLAGLTIRNVYLSNNNFTGEVALFNMEWISNLLIDNNSFTSFNSTIRKPYNLKDCNASGNPFKCPIPDWVISECNATCT
jgi:hypothetical protein